MRPAKLKLAHLPTPLWRHPALDALVGCSVWVKRDDMSEGAAAGNKIRKLEYLLAEAGQQRAHVVITCGGLQSNHARATALLARQLGMDSLLLLRSTSLGLPTRLSGNLFLDRFVGAEVRLISAEQYRDRTQLMAGVARELAQSGKRAYVIPEGGSSGLGSLGYVDAMGELRAQLDAGEAGAPARFDAIVHACGSGGTAAGVALGNQIFGIADRAVAMAVCDNRTYFAEVTARLIAEARALLPDPPGAQCAAEIEDRFKGPGYGVASDDQVAFIAEVARHTGLILDPVYTGKALYGLAQLAAKPERVLFIHTGGLPGLLAQSDDFAAFL